MYEIALALSSFGVHESYKVEVHKFIYSTHYTVNSFYHYIYYLFLV